MNIAIKRWESDDGRRPIRLRECGHAELLDFDTPDSGGADPFRDWYRLLERHAPDLAARLCIVRTPSGAHHVPYRCPEVAVPTHHVLAAKYWLHPTDPGQDRAETLIETRGEGGYALCPPGDGYRSLRGSHLDLPVIGSRERDLLHQIAALFTLGSSRPKVQPVREPHARPTGPDADTPWERYNQQATNASTLALFLRHGWQDAGGDGEGQRVRRPGAASESSGTLGLSTPGWFHCFSSNAAPFEAGHNYSPFQVLDYGGDGPAAAAALWRESHALPHRGGAIMQHPVLGAIAAADPTATFRRIAGIAGGGTMTLLPLSRPWPAVERGDVVFAVSDAGRTDRGLEATVHAANGRYTEATTLVLTQPAERLALAERVAPSMHLETLAAAQMLLDLVPPVEARVRADDGWEPPIDLSSLPRLPAFPVEIFPGWLKEYVEAVAEFSQTPTDLAGMLALAVLALAGQRLALLEVRPQYVEPLNLYILVAMGSGERKSAVYRALTGPVYDYEASLAERLAPEIAKRATERHILEHALQRATLEAGKKGASGAMREHALDLAQQLAAIGALAEPVLVIQDSTPEAMVRELAEQGGLLAALDAEGGLLDSLTGRYNDQGPNLDPLLKAHACDEIRSARITRGKVSVKQPTLTMGIAPQPEVLVALESKPGAKGRGLLARFLYGLPCSYKGRRKQEGAPIPMQVALAYRQRLGRLLAASEPTVLGEHHTRATMCLTPGAYRAWLEFAAWLEPYLTPGAALGGTDGWAEKLVGQTARIAATLHLADGEQPLTQCAQPVSAGAMERAITVAVRYLVPHALAAFRYMRADPAVGDAQTILAWIERNDRTEFTARHVYKDLGSHFARPEAVLPGLETLVQHGALRALPSERTGAGRKPSPTYVVNPRLSQNRQNRQNSPPPEEIDLPGVLRSFDRNRQNSATSGGTGVSEPNSVYFRQSARGDSGTPPPEAGSNSVYSGQGSAQGTGDEGEVEL